MPKILPVYYENNFSYNIIIENNFDNLFKNINEIKSNNYQRVCIFSDDIVAEHYLNEIKSIFEEKFNCVISYVIPNGENSKTLSNVEKLYEELIKNHFDRHDLLVALGGGVVGDMTGFAAATYLRGIDFVQIPTTLLSQVDSSIGGKTGVDYLQYKNMVGAFYMPKLVYINVNTLQTLSDSQLQSGMGEAIKHGLIRNPSYYQWLQEHRDLVNSKDPDTLEQLVYENCCVKKAVVEEDPKEQGIRAHLNFGHTIGHAIEKLSDFRLYHGQCVALGMCAAGYISWKRGLISELEYLTMEQVIDSFGLPIKLMIPMNPQDILQTTKSDKKMVGNHVKFILLESIGDAKIYSDVSDDEMLEAIESLLD